MDTIMSSIVVASNSGEEGLSSSSSSSSEEFHNEEELNRVQEQVQNQDRHQRRRRRRHLPGLYQLNISLFREVPSGLRDEALSACFVLTSLWIFACMTVILGFYGPSTIPLQPNYARLLKANSFFVQSIQTKEIHDSLPGPILYGFDEVPPLDVLVTWSEKHDAAVESGEHMEWQYFLNPGSQIRISYSINSQNSAGLSLVIAQGSGSLIEWVEDPSYPNTTLSWNIVHGNGTMEQEILSSNTYYIALANLNFQVVEVQLNFTIEALTYNTTQAYYNCSLTRHPCSLNLHLFEANAVLLTSPGPELGVTNYKWCVELSYSQRWISYLMGSASVTVLILVILKLSSTCQSTRGYGASLQVGRTGTERAPLLSSAKDDDLSSLGSSYDSMSQDEEEFNESLALTALDGKKLEGESNNDPKSVCVLCLDALRDCFFLPCGHNVACFTCGTRVIEEACVCPVCRRTTKKVRRIFSV